MLTLELVKNLAIAAILGGLIGLQREQVKGLEKAPKFAGVRTFTLIAMLGAIAVYIGDAFSRNVFLVVLAGYILLAAVAYWIESNFSGHIGGTGEIAGILTFLVGALSAIGQTYIAIFTAVIMTLILAMKEPLHRFASRLKKEEMHSTLTFAIIAFIILPLLPNKAFGPFSVLNPFIIWLMVVLISGLSFAAYVLIRVFGARHGIGITGFFGGLVSSTAITTSLSSQSRKSAIVNPFVFGIIIAGAVMFIRILIIVFVVNKALLAGILVPIGVMGIAGLACAGYAWFRRESQENVREKGLKLSSPFALSPALKFAVFFAFILFISKAGQVLLGSSAVYAVSFLSGLADVDAITVSLANLAKSGDISSLVASMGIVIAAATNTAVKAGIVFWIGSRQVSRRVIVLSALMLAAGIAAAVLAGYF